MKGSPIALLTDFGTRDPYVPAVKGAILAGHPSALIIDISHEIPRHDVESAAYHLWCVTPWFPKGTIFVCVVDPGVGTSRRILVLKLSGRTFIAPDNGILNYLTSMKDRGRAYALKFRDYGGVSRTFHGRDLFAPAAARLAKGRPVSSIATPVAPPAPRRLFMEIPARPKGPVRGKVLHIDNFGNIVTSLRCRDHPLRRSRVAIGGRIVRRIAETYSTAPPGKPFLIVGSTGLLEISIRNGDAARSLRVRTGAPVRYSAGHT